MKLLDDCFELCGEGWAFFVGGEGFFGGYLLKCSGESFDPFGVGIFVGAGLEGEAVAVIFKGTSEGCAVLGKGDFLRAKTEFSALAHVGAEEGVADDVEVVGVDMARVWVNERGKRWVIAVTGLLCERREFVEGVVLRSTVVKK